jgi:hypothetical protein
MTVLAVTFKHANLSTIYLKNINFAVTFYDRYKDII